MRSGSPFICLLINTCIVRFVSKVGIQDSKVNNTRRVELSGADANGLTSCSVEIFL